MCDQYYGCNAVPGGGLYVLEEAFGPRPRLRNLLANAVVQSGRLDEVLATVLLARKTLQIVRQNLLWAGVYNLVAVPLALVGWMPPWLAGLGMAASSLLVIGNAMRLAREAGPRQA